MAQAAMLRTIRIFGLQEPKSANEPRKRKRTIWMAKEMPLHRRTME